MRALLVAALVLAAGCSRDDEDDEDWVKDRYGEGCTIAATCGDLMYVDCGAATDGPAYYVDRSTRTQISECGGLRPPPPDCPPAAWTCEL